MKRSMISIIVPVYNAAGYIRQTIGSVCAQTYTDWELLLVDDRSKDDSVQLIGGIIAEYEKSGMPEGKIRLIRKENNEGAARARNTGLDEAGGRYIAFLDADDIWRPEKLEKQLSYMDKTGAAFVFTSYEFGDADAVPTGKAVRVPRQLSYRKALTRTIIFTSTTLFDTERMDRKLLYMPDIGSEDTATWWRILQSGVTAYGLDMPLVIYRRPAGASLSSSKTTAVKRIWNLYRNVAGLSAVSSVFCMLGWAFHASVRRILDDTVRRHMESFRHFAVLQLSLIGMILLAAIYAVAWFREYYPVLNSISYSKEGYLLGYGIKFTFWGHLLILAVYFLLLLFLSRTAGDTRTGYRRPREVFSGQAMALFLTNLITYLQVSLMRNWLVSVKPILTAFILQLALAAVWAYLSERIYLSVFPPVETLVVTGGEQDTAVSGWFSTRKDRFRVVKEMPLSAGLPAIEEECLRWYGCVAIGNVDPEIRKELTQYCYQHYIRVLFMPEAYDILFAGARYTPMFGTPALEVREYSLRWEQRVIKRLVDIFLALVLMVIGLPVWAYRKLSGKGALRTDICRTKDGNLFECTVFEKEGFGRTLPMLPKVLSGAISMVGPAPVPAEGEYLFNEKDAPADPAEYTDEEKAAAEADRVRAWRYRVKAGIISYAAQQATEESSPEDLLRCDIYYVQNYSLLLDLRILLQALSGAGI